MANGGKTGARGLPSALALWAALAASGAASAGDLPGQTPDPALRICSAFGSGYYYIPGSDTCLKLGGRVRFEILVNEVWSRAQSPIGYRARGRIDLDARNQTEFGVLRASARFQSTISTGTYARSVPSYDNDPTEIREDTIIQRAFIEFAGFTAGRFVSFFDFYGNDLNWGGTLGSARPAINGLAYTAAWGSGLSTSLSFESPLNRTIADENFVMAGMGMPETVANIRLDRNWGSAQLSGALHPIRPAYTADFTSGTSQWGWALQAGLKFNLPMLAEGDTIWGQAAYADGALNYLGLGRNSFRVGRVKYTLSDVYFVDNTMQRTSGFSFTGAFTHYWTPIIQQSAFASYTQTDPTAAASALFPRVSQAGLWQVGSNLVWTPLKGVELGSELMWYQVSGAKMVNATEPGFGPLDRGQGWQLRTRLQRDF